LGASPQEFESLILRQEASRPGYGVAKVRSLDELLDLLRTVVMGPPRHADSGSQVSQLVSQHDQ
jgi:hypothetical protein